MPVWGEIISAQQVSDLISYLRAGLPAVPTAEPPPMPQGQGPRSQAPRSTSATAASTATARTASAAFPTRSRPTRRSRRSSGADFRSEFNTDKKIIDFIRSGSVLGRAPIVSMPHWGGIISDAEPAGARRVPEDAEVDLERALARQRAPDQELLDLARAFVERRHARVAQVLLHGELVDVAVAAVHLHRPFAARTATSLA